MRDASSIMHFVQFSYSQRAKYIARSSLRSATTRKKQTTMELPTLPKRTNSREERD
jgi:hypothetical protein